MRVYLPYAKQCTTNSALSIVTSEWVFPVNRRGNGRSKMLCTYSGLIQRMACILSTPHCFHCASLRLHVWCRRQNSILGQYSYVHSSLHKCLLSTYVVSGTVLCAGDDTVKCFAHSFKVHIIHCGPCNDRML